jgi:DNA modification methylase
MENRRIGRTVLINGDCVEAMAAMPDACVDSVVCDPPYGLKFMGKKWDAPGLGFVERKPETGQKFDMIGGNHNPTCSADAARTRRAEGQRQQQWHMQWLEQALRVLKPGGHLIAFGGSRTYHRLACAAEDVGFEVRDMLQWNYGSGFPKSHNVGKAIDKANGKTRADIVRLKRIMRDLLGASKLTAASWNEACGFEASGYLRESSTWACVLPSEEKWRVMRATLCAEVDLSPDFIEAERTVISAKPWDNSAACFEVGADHTKRIRGNVTAPATPEAAQWEGWGTALKPAHEPAILARKPLTGTVAANVREHGTGAVNIDGCRVGATGGSTIPSGMDRLNADNAAQGYRPGTYQQGTPTPPKGGGRWPANVILSHHPECKPAGTRKVKTTVAGAKSGGFEGGLFGEDDGHTRDPDLVLGGGYADADGTETIEAWECHPDCPVAILDGQSGITKNTSHYSYKRSDGDFIDTIPDQPAKRYWRVDKGGASRFFYTAKASRAEREDGCEHLGVTNERKRGNHHPTVKPIALMQYLIRLVTPPGGVVLDPFTGSGSAAVAAEAEGMRCIAIEREAEYYEIAEARLRFGAKG